MRLKYQKASKKAKKQLLSNASEMTGYHRVYVAKLLREKQHVIDRRLALARTRHHRACKYSLETKQAIVRLWKAANCIAAARLHPFISALMNKLIACDELEVSGATETQLSQISLATVKRILGKASSTDKVNIGGTTKPGSLLKRQITVRYGRWDETVPGWCETDTVAHCGENLVGRFIYSLNIVDICSGWSEQVAVLGKSERVITPAMENLRIRLPFELLGLDMDNGSEFINYSMLAYGKKHHLTLTRSRPYRKNDNAHVEQKNYTAIRKLVGYVRYDTTEQLNLLNDLYQNEWRLYLNYFQPTMKVREVVKDLTTGKKTKRYYEAKTPYQRLMQHPNTTKQQKAMLQSTYDSLNPVELQRRIQWKLERLNKLLMVGFQKDF
jgi:hypothetical protein